MAARVQVVHQPTTVAICGNHDRGRLERAVTAGTCGFWRSPSGISGEGAPSLGVVLTFDGVERQRYMGGGWQLSPDGRYLLQMEPVGGAASELGTIYTLIDQRTALRYRLFLPWASRWLADGRLAGF